MEDFSIYVAKIVGECTKTDNRLAVRILPQMDDTSIPDSLCPRWPFFFRDQVLTGAYGDLVWVICDNEFSSGYIMGEANYNTYVENNFVSGKVNSTDKKDTNFSIPEKLIEKVSDVLVNLKSEILSLSNVKVTFWNDTCIHFIERSSGGVFIAFYTGTIYIFRSDEMIMKIGQSCIKLNSDGFSVTGQNNINLQSKYVGLGLEPSGQVLVTDGADATVSKISNNVRA